MKIKVGDKLKVKSLEWFKKNCVYSRGILLYYYDSDKNFLGVTKYMLEFCGKIVTAEEIRSNHSILIVETQNIFWMEDFFECILEFDPIKLITSIDSYCNKFCVFKDDKNLDNCKKLKCPLYNLYKIKEL